jgi:uncharacterized protein YndB with AHSA1/START domain
MERKTKVDAETGTQDIYITREFDLPLELLFKAHIEPEIFEQWMSHEYGTTRVLKLEARKHGGWQFQTVDAQGNVLFGANGVFQEFIPEQKITRTFEMENSPFPVQLEFLEFERLTDETSRLRMQIVFKSAEHRDQLLSMPFAQGLDMAHNRLQEVLGKLKLAH